ncbi:E3 ubiquitin-protein ligase MIB1-like isoform X2 [Gossypium australe]|uniref:E3 ubiquitin-protein ligase MIB1-like isoform X2 n=1 Tax=Gossypium australe TaxID=47621 RepID=A0A5B6WK47_9ROSI|nr:E3 ubiquitin-protein ligase MIB1-like isoform X2 [Gossypium australe]
MDENLRKAARTGKVNELYRVIQRNGNILRRVDEVEFIDTPLHIAAEEGCVEFAMEMMNLKPSFARKLNQQGLSPLHIAVRKGHKEMALRFLEIDKHLVRVRGKKGKTPLHYLCKVGNQLGLLEKFLEASPDCIQDVTIENRTALHIAIQNNRLDVLQLLITTLKRKNYSWEVVNRKDKDGNTALHTAAIHNQPKADKHATNQVGLTALAAAQQHNIRENIAILQGFFIPVVSNLKHKLEKKVKYLTKASILIFQNMDNISADDRNALLVILGLLLTATYQATLSPPGGVWQGENTSKSKGSYDEDVLGSSVMGQRAFFLFYIPTYVVFLVTLFLTLALLKTFPRDFRTALQVLLAFFAVSFDKSISHIAPTDLTMRILNIFSGILFLLMVSMCIVFRVSKISVLIVGCWIFLSFYYNYFHNITSMTALGMGVGQGLALFFTLYDEFWKGTIFIVCYCLFASFGIISENGDGFSFTRVDLSYFVALIGCWLFLSLGRLCIMRCSQICNTFS